jgi:hypothetical protein
MTLDIHQEHRQTRTEVLWVSPNGKMAAPIKKPSNQIGMFND